MNRLLAIIVASAAIAGGFVSGRDAQSEGLPQTIAIADVVGNTGVWGSLVLDASGNPVVSYARFDTWDLKVLHCGDPACTSGNTVATPDTIGTVGATSSIALDAQGRPVISYLRGDTGDLKVLHCGNPNCTADNVITSPDTAGVTGAYTSLELTSAGNPIISYQRNDTEDLKVLHCGNPNCTSGNSIASPDTQGHHGYFTSLELDASGRPVVASYSAGYSGLSLLHCGNPFCTANNTIRAVDTNGDTGLAPSLTLDAAGRPVVAYYRADTGDLKVLHCNDAVCDGNNESIVLAATAGDVGAWASLVLDADGRPVVSYWRYDNVDLKVLHCGNPNCTANNTITAPDTAGATGAFTSLALDASGNPVVSYHHLGITRDLKVLHCNNPTCSGIKPPTATPTRTDTPTFTTSSTPTHTPTATPSPTITPTATPKNLSGDTDGDTVTNDLDDNDDNDGCSDAQETGLNVTAGGLRDPHNFWDFFDVPTGVLMARDGSIASTDIFAVMGRFNSVGNAGIDPLSTPDPPPAYHTAYDRTVIADGNAWNLGPPNGAIAGTDFFAIIAQFNHSCA